MHFIMKMLVIFTIISMLISPVTAISVSVTPDTIDFGNLNVNGSSNFVPGTVTVGGAGPKTPLDLRVYVSGPFTNGSNIITLDNFQYSFNNRGYIALSTTPQVVLSNFQTPGKNPFSEMYKLTVPYGTEPGTYSTTIYHQLVPTGTALSPVTTISQITPLNNSLNTSTENVTGNLSNNTNNTTTLMTENIITVIYALIQL